MNASSSNNRIRTPLAAIPHIEQYAGLWCVEEQRFAATLHQLERIDIHAHIRASMSDDPAAERVAAKAARVDRNATSGGYIVNSNGIAVMEMVGYMTKYGTSMSSCPGCLQLRQSIRHSAANPDVRGIFLKIDSPGGTTAGVDDLARDIAAAAQRKPVAAYIEDCCCSAAYYVASQASRISANHAADVGSIGVYAVVEDWSAAYESSGIKVHVLSSGAFKGAGVEGSKITNEQLTQWQSRIDDAAGQFVDTVARGRRMNTDTVKALATGAVWSAPQAANRGLIDAVESLDAALEHLQSIASTTPTEANSDARNIESEGSDRLPEPCSHAKPHSFNIKPLKENPPMTTSTIAKPHVPAQAADNPEAWAREFKASPKLQAEFATEKAYVAFRKAESAGIVKIIGGKTVRRD